MTPKIPLLVFFLFLSCALSAKANQLVVETTSSTAQDKSLESFTPIQNRLTTLFSKNRVMALSDVSPNQAASTSGSRRKKLASFSSSKLINPVVGQKKLTLVHTPGHENTGGFFGPNVRGRKHMGIDIQAKVSTTIQAAGTGEVHFVGSDRRGYGLYVVVRHETNSGKIFETRYAHLSKIYVKTGDKVYQGDILGLSGRTGNAKKTYVLPHVHFEYREVIDGKALAMNPLPHLVKYVPSNLKNYFAKEGLLVRK